MSTRTFELDFKNFKMKFYSWGANSHGQLGQNLKSEVCCIATEVTDLCLDPESIVSIVGGGGHSLILDRLGQVFSCGWNNRGQLGGTESEVSTFRRVESFPSSPVVQLACGWDSSLAVSSDGLLLVWGSNSHSQLSISKDKCLSLQTPKCLPIARVKQAALGLRHLVLVTTEGKVFVAGSGSKGQLGIVDVNGHPFRELDLLTQVPYLDNISAVSCGQHHCLALSQTGKIFVWGDNKFGQLGLDPKVQLAVYKPQELSLPAEIGFRGSPSSIMTGWTHSVVLTDEAELINWGRNTYGQLGSDGKARSSSWHPSSLKFCERIKQVVVGSEHNLALTETGNIFSWGWNEHGNCGTGSQENILSPSRVQVAQRELATLIGTGACHSFAVLEKNASGTADSK